MLTGRWFPQIVDYKGQWESISNIYITKIVVLVSEPVRGRSRATELPCFIYLYMYPVLISLLIDTQNCISNVAYFTRLVFYMNTDQFLI